MTVLLDKTKGKSRLIFSARNNEIGCIPKSFYWYRSYLCSYKCLRDFKEILGNPAVSKCQQHVTQQNSFLPLPLQFFAITMEPMGEIPKDPRQTGTIVAKALDSQRFPLPSVVFCCGSDGCKRGSGPKEPMTYEARI